jgi:hypothetical protein
MKKYLYLLLFVIFSILEQGCDKNDLNPSIEKKADLNINKSVLVEGNVNEKAPDLRTIIMWPLTDAFGHIIGWNILGCTWPSTNCLPTVVITPPDGDKSPTEEAYIDFIDKFNRDRIEEFFSEGDYLSLFPSLTNMPDVVKKFVDSDLNLYLEIGKDGLDYYIGLPIEIDYKSDWRGQEEIVFVIDKQKK